MGRYFPGEYSPPHFTEALLFQGDTFPASPERLVSQFAMTVLKWLGLSHYFPSPSSSIGSHFKLLNFPFQHVPEALSPILAPGALVLSDWGAESISQAQLATWRDTRQPWCPRRAVFLNQPRAAGICNARHLRSQMSLLLGGKEDSLLLFGAVFPMLLSVGSALVPHYFFSFLAAARRWFSQGKLLWAPSNESVQGILLILCPGRPGKPNAFF